MLSCGGDDEQIVIWEAETGDKFKTLTGDDQIVNVAKFSPDGMLLASGSKHLKLWDPFNSDKCTKKLSHRF